MAIPRTRRPLTSSLCSRSHGFTLIELVISIVLIGLLAGVGVTMISDSFTTARLVDAGESSAAQARYVLERLEREIREVKYDRTNSNYCIASPTTTNMTANNLAFYKTSSGSAYSSTCATNADLITINKNGANLTLKLNTGTPATLSDQVSANAGGTDLLVYLDANGAVTASASAVRFVVITLTLSDSISGQKIAQRITIALRNA